VLFCTGLGTVSPAVADGAAAATAISITTNPVQVTIGGKDAGTAAFAGLAPGFAGLYQVNVTVPAATPTGSSVPLIVTVAGLSSVAVPIAVQ
jgi:uncharacterized protein (TIGR03437 family)